MYTFLLVISTALIACTAQPLSASRQGSFNRYYVFSRENARTPVPLDAANVTSALDSILITRNTTIIVHGHQGSATTSLNPTVKDAFLISEDINVIVVDWSVYAGLSYSNAVSAVPSVGAFLADLITVLVDNSVVTLNTLHLVGFDLGAHVVGFTGRRLNGAVARITGLNPSGNQWGSNSQRLSLRDAQYVEVIHTDGNGFLGNGVGEAIGHVDFFANGGNGQPGCFLNNACSHNRAWELFAASLTHNHLIGNQCGNWVQVSLNTCRGFQLTMGNNDFVKLGTGMFRVNTRWTYPF